MSSPNVIPLTPADIALYERLHAAERLAAGQNGPVTLEQMIEGAREEGFRIESGARAAVIAYGGEFDAGVIQRARIQRAIAVLLDACLAKGKSELRAFLSERPQPQRRRA